jgi:hypothetical protein
MLQSVFLLRSCGAIYFETNTNLSLLEPSPKVLVHLVFALGLRG